MQEEKKTKNGAETAEIGFIAVHLGAGYHSKAKLPRYKALCNKACKLGMQLCKSGYLASEIACKVVSILEDSELTNAGIGSNLTKDMTVQCDAGIMDSLSGNFGAVGCLEGIRNPIRAAYEVLRSQENYVQGLVPPMILVGDSARTFAIEKGVESISSGEMITENAVDSFHKAVGVLRKEYSVKHDFKVTGLQDKLLKGTRPNVHSKERFLDSGPQEVEKDSEVYPDDDTEICDDLSLLPNEESRNLSKTAAAAKGTQYESQKRKAPRHKRKSSLTDKDCCFKALKVTRRSSSIDYSTNHQHSHSHSNIDSCNACSFDSKQRPLLSTINDLSKGEIDQNSVGCHDEQSGNLLLLNPSSQDLPHKRPSRETSSYKNSSLNQQQTLQDLSNEGPVRATFAINNASLIPQQASQDLSSEESSRKKSSKNKSSLNKQQTPQDLSNKRFCRATISNNNASLISQQTSQDLSNERFSRENSSNNNSSLNQRQTTQDLSNKRSSREKSSNTKSDRELLMDTVGVICVDKFGNICSAVSSGGLLLKQPGRIGQAACYGGGCFVAEENRDSDVILTASSVSGCGEQLIKTNLAKHCAETLLSDDIDVMLNPSYLLEKGFLDSRYLKYEEEKLAGCINVRLTRSNGQFNDNASNSRQGNCLADETADQKSGQDDVLFGPCSLDLIIACTTKSFCCGFMSSTHKKTTAVLLEIPERKKPGNSVVSQVFHFEL